MNFRLLKRPLQPPPTSNPAPSPRSNLFQRDNHIPSFGSRLASIRTFIRSRSFLLNLVRFLHPIICSLNVIRVPRSYQDDWQPFAQTFVQLDDVAMQAPLGSARKNRNSRSAQTHRSSEKPGQRMHPPWKIFHRRNMVR